MTASCILDHVMNVHKRLVPRDPRFWAGDHSTGARVGDRVLWVRPEGGRSLGTRPSFAPQQCAFCAGSRTRPRNSGGRVQSRSCECRSRGQATRPRALESDPAADTQNAPLDRLRGRMPLAVATRPPLALLPIRSHPFHGTTHRRDPPLDHHGAGARGEGVQTDARLTVLRHRFFDGKRYRARPDFIMEVWLSDVATAARQSGPGASPSLVSGPDRRSKRAQAACPPVGSVAGLRVERFGVHGPKRAMRLAVRVRGR
jgi:hypothetical protein